jgi:hypothetical protein
MLNDALRHWVCFLFESEEPVNQACGGGAKERPYPINVVRFPEVRDDCRAKDSPMDDKHEKER